VPRAGARARSRLASPRNKIVQKTVTPPLFYVCGPTSQDVGIKVPDVTTLVAKRVTKTKVI